MSRIIFFLALCVPFVADATISFGDQAASIVIEGESTLHVNGDVFLTGTVVNNGTLTIADGASFDVSEGIYIDHGGLKRVFNQDTTLFNDISLSSQNTLTMSSLDVEGGTIVVTGTGQKITFSDLGSDQVIIGDNTTVVLRNIELVGYSDGVISFGEGSSLYFAASTVSLTKDVFEFTPMFYFIPHDDMPLVPSYIRGNGHTLVLSAGALSIEADTSLVCDAVIFESLNSNHIQGHAGSSIEFSDCTLQINNEAFFNEGALSFKGSVMMTGSGSFIYSSSDSITIREFSTLHCKGVTFAHASEELACAIIGDSILGTSHLVLDDAVLYSQVPVLNLFSLQVTSTGNSIVQSLPFTEGEGSFYGAVNIGGVNAQNNSSLRCSSGTLTLYDVVCNVVDY
jgi:hypothetical protein